MSEHPSDRIQALFFHAVDLASEERETFLSAACGYDTGMRASVDRLLAADEAADANEAWGSAALANEARVERLAPDTSIGAMIGPYRLLELIGRGGMGRVYRAVRADQQYDKYVAVKQISAGFDAHAVANRFRAERQILATLEHPNIARLLDGGMDTQGMPYIIMEYVEGEQAAEYCANHGLTLRQRLELFREICAAVHYAHQRMVVHRDLKPANILVTSEGTPKLLDFGIAKVLNPEGEKDNSNTETGQYLMTARFCSPEQARGELVTTASDVYSLGVILYELVSGHSPYRNPDAPSHELLRSVCEDDPPKPSLHARELAGDLDNICLKALKKIPLQRYSSADQFSEDIRLYLDHRPVLARGVAFTYVAAKFVRRNKAAVAAAAVVLLTLAGGLVMVNQARARAESRFNDVRELAHSVIFDYQDSIEPLPGSLPVRVRLVKDGLGYLQKLSAEAETPDLQREIIESYVRISRVQGDTYGSNLGDTAGATESANRAVRGAERLLTKDHGARSLEAAADAFAVQASLLASTGKLDDAARLYTRCIELRTQAAIEAPDDIDNGVELSSMLSHLGDIEGGVGLENLGNLSAAVDAYQRADVVVAKLDARFPNRAPLVRQRFSVLQSLSAAESGLGNLEKSLGMLREALSQVEKLEKSAPTDSDLRYELASTEGRLGIGLVDSRQAGEAILHLQRAVSVLQALARADPQNSLYQRALGVAESNLANGLRVAGDTNAALTHTQTAIALAEALSRADPENADYRVDVAIGHRRLAETLLARGDAKAAIAKAREAQSVLCANSGQNNSHVEAHCGRAALIEGVAELKLNHFAAAAAPLQRAAAIARSTVRNDPMNAVYLSDVARAHASLAIALARWGHRAEAQNAYDLATQTWASLKSQSKLTPEDNWRAAEASRQYSAVIMNPKLR